MFDRLVRSIASLLVLVVAIAFNLRLFIELVRSWAAVVPSPPLAVRHPLGDLGLGVLGLLFTVGLFVRVAQFVANRDPGAARERASRDRAVRQRVRRPAEGVPPVESRAEVLDDPDPAIGEEERG